jgi:hypothetical protein
VRKGSPPGDAVVLPILRTVVIDNRVRLTRHMATASGLLGVGEMSRNDTSRNRIDWSDFTGGDDNAAAEWRSAGST